MLKRLYLVTEICVSVCIILQLHGAVSRHFTSRPQWIIGWTTIPSFKWGLSSYLHALERWFTVRVNLCP